MQEVHHYRLMQNSLEVASVSGSPVDAWIEIRHYATTYRQDGPADIEFRVGDRWEPVAEE